MQKKESVFRKGQPRPKWFELIVQKSFRKISHGNYLQKYSYASREYFRGNPEMRNYGNDYFLTSDIFRWCVNEKCLSLKCSFYIPLQTIRNQWGNMFCTAKSMGTICVLMISGGSTLSLFLKRKVNSGRLKWQIVFHNMKIMETFENHCFHSFPG